MDRSNSNVTDVLQLGVHVFSKHVVVLRIADTNLLLNQSHCRLSQSSVYILSNINHIEQASAQKFSHIPGGGGGGGGARAG